MTGWDGFDDKDDLYSIFYKATDIYLVALTTT